MTWASAEVSFGDIRRQIVTHGTREQVLHPSGTRHGLEFLLGLRQLAACGIQRLIQCLDLLRELDQCLDVDDGPLRSGPRGSRNKEKSEQAASK